MLCAATKRFASTFVTDVEGAVWRVPHQHSLHYGAKLAGLRFAIGTCGGFVEEDLNPVVTVLESTLEPDWRICEMFCHGLRSRTRPNNPGPCSNRCIGCGRCTVHRGMLHRK